MSKRSNSMSTKAERLVAAFARGLIAALSTVEDEGVEGNGTRPRPARKAVRKRTRVTSKTFPRQEVQTPLRDNLPFPSADTETELLASAKEGLREGAVTTDDLFTMDDVDRFLRTVKTREEEPRDTYNKDADPEQSKTWVAPS